MRFKLADYIAYPLMWLGSVAVVIVMLIGAICVAGVLIFSFCAAQVGFWMMAYESNPPDKWFVFWAVIVNLLSIGAIGKYTHYRAHLHDNDTILDKKGTPA